MATDLPLLQNTDDTDTIDAKCILTEHSETLNIGLNDRNTEQMIISALGGTDAILKYYLENNILDTQQLKIVDSILRECELKSNSSTTDLPIYGTIVLNTSNTFWHKICKFETAEKIITFLYHKVVATIVSILLFFHSICVAIENAPNSKSKPYMFTTAAYHGPITVIDFMAIIYAISIILSSNIKAFKFSTKTFEFWFKLFYAVGSMISSLLYITMGKGIGGFEIFLHTLRYIQVLVIVILYSLMDGINIASWIKGGIGICFAIYISVYALYYTLTETIEYGVSIQSLDITISMLDIVASTNRVLSIFLWKQTILYLWKHDKATIINTWIDIKWIDIKCRNGDSVYKVINLTKTVDIDI